QLCLQRGGVEPFYDCIVPVDLSAAFHDIRSNDRRVATLTLSYCTARIILEIVALKIVAALGASDLIPISVLLCIQPLSALSLPSTTQPVVGAAGSILTDPVARHDKSIGFGDHIFDAHSLLPRKEHRLRHISTQGYRILNTRGQGIDVHLIAIRQSNPQRRGVQGQLLHHPRLTIDDALQRDACSGSGCPWTPRR